MATRLRPSPKFKIEGTETLYSDLDQVKLWATRIGGRYMGSELAETYGRRNGVPGGLLVRVKPSRITGYKDVAS